MTLNLILDTNRIISALINKNSIIRDILLSEKVEFYCPEFVLKEIDKYKSLILEKSSLSESEFYFTLHYLLKRITFVKKEEFKHKLAEAERIMKKVDINDTEFVALALSIQNDGIFSNDSDFEKANIKRWSVQEIIQKIR